MSNLKFKRILLKLSGEALAGEKGFGTDPSIVEATAKEIVEVAKQGVEIAIVIGGGNIVRGVSASAQGMERTTGDQMGMLATVMNCLAMQDALEKQGADTRVLSGLDIASVCEPFVKRNAVRYLSEGKIILLAAGTGNPYFTTDSAATLRGLEIDADVIMKATKVDGVYTADPVKDSSATKYDNLTFSVALEKNLKIMDTTAFALCRDNNLPILVFQMTYGNLEAVVKGEKVGTLVSN